MPSLFDPALLGSLPHETPFFAFSRERIVQNLSEFRQHFPEAAIHYAMKANSEPEVLATVANAGHGFEVASVHELEMLKPLEVAPERIIYGTSVKPESHIKRFAAYGVDRFAVDSEPELEKIARAAPGARVYVRASVDDTGSVFRFSEKFGVDPSLLAPLLQRAMELGLQPHGVSFHVGSQATNPAAWANAIEHLGAAFRHFDKIGIAIVSLNLGGGYPCRYASPTHDSTMQAIADSTLAACAKLSTQPQLIIEPGRAVIADAAVLVTTVIARTERRGVTWLFLDAGVYNALYEALAFQGSTRYRVSSLRHPCDAETETFALAGPTGDSHDVITRAARLPQDVAVGDKLAFHAVGAYSLAVASTFNGFPKPAVHFL